MVRFLSEDWVRGLADALNSSGNEALGTTTFKLQQVVTGGPDAQTAYWVAFKDGTVTAGLGETADPDVTITQDHGTATDLARGEVNPQGAFMQGRLKVTGNMGSLLQNQDAIAALSAAMSSLETEYVT